MDILFRKGLGIANLKGGIGKTLFALNLSFVLHQFYRDIILVDLDLFKSDLSILLNINVNNYIDDFLNDNIDDFKKSIYLTDSGLKIAPSKFNQYVYTDKQINKIPELIKKINGFSELAIYDLPSNFTRITEKAFQTIDYFIIITDCDFISLANALKTKRLIESNNKNILGVVVNHINTNPYKHFNIKQIESYLELKVLANLIYDEKIFDHYLFKDFVDDSKYIESIKQMVKTNFLSDN